MTIKEMSTQIISTFLMMLDSEVGDGVNDIQYGNLCDLLTFVHDDIYNYITERVIRSTEYPYNYTIYPDDMEAIYELVGF